MLLKTAAIAGLFGLDEYVKQQVEDSLEEGESGKYFRDRITLRKIYNRGFMFSSLEDKSFFVKLSTLVSTAALLIMNEKTEKKGNAAEKMGMTILLAGASSNSFDRLIRGKVIDYIPVEKDRKKKEAKQVTANLGDFYIALGGSLFFLGRFFH